LDGTGFGTKKITGLKKTDMTMRLRIILLLAIMVMSANAWSQPAKNFSKEPQAFLDELTVMFDAAQTKEQKDAGKILMADFSDMWLNNKFSKPYQDSIYTMCNIMLKRKMKTFPNFEGYLNAAIQFGKSSQSEESFNAWCFSLRNLAKMSNSIRFMALTDATNSLLTNNTLYQTQIMLWKSSSDEFTFKYDSLPFVEFGKCNLTCLRKNDSSVIYDTRGKYYPTTNNWEGMGGKILWDRAGFPENEVHAEIFKYSVSIQKSEFSIDTVRFYNTNFFDRPLMGSLIEKVLVDVGEDRISYPRFTSFDKRLQIKEIYKNVDFDGGFAMYGPKLLGIGDKETDAFLYFKSNNKIFVKLAAKNFIIRKNTVASDRASASVYWEKDSIFHPGLKIRFNSDSAELSLMRDKVGIAQSPFYDSYHKVDIYAEAMYWRMTEPLINLEMLKGAGSESSAMFESDDYYSEFRYEKLKGMEEVHPLYLLRDIAVAKGSKTFTVDDVQNKMRVGKDQVITFLIDYANRGFLMYDMDDELVTIKDRVYHYLNSKNHKTDYDVIQFNSVITAQPNGTINLLNFDLKLRGVSVVYLSDSQSVFVMPTNQELTLKKNRDFVFDGQIHAGLFDFYGKNCTFNYDKFKFDLPTVDSMSFKVQDYALPADAFGIHPFRKVLTVIEDLVGEILIDDPGNKSGIVKFPRYPIFNSKKESYVYYDKSYIYGGVYTRDRFYYRLQPFSIDTLDSYFSERKEFKGYLVSAGIFPDIPEPLVVQPDFSLGFVLQTPATGFPAYGGKGIYDSIIDLSYKGFRGRGNLKYLTSIMKSNEIVFFPDSMYAQALKYEIKEKTTATEYPGVIAENVFVQWYPYKDLMHIVQKDKPFAMYNNGSTLYGTLTLEPKGLTGDGTLSFSKVEMKSNDYEFKHHTFQSDTTDVVFKTPDLSEMVLKTVNFNVNIDFQKQLGKFKSNDENSKISFPFNNYACYMYNFDWYMNKDELLMKSANKEKYQYVKTMKKEEIIDEDLTESQFISEHPAQDSLHFYAPEATYNLGENIIYAKDVPMILVADAAIFPDSGKVTVLKKAEMLPLEHALVIANTENKKHLLFDCKLNVETRQKYSGDGNYNYVDITDTKQKIFMNNIHVDSLKTRAEGDITEKAGFTLSPDFGYWGKVKLTAEKDFLNFNGGTRIKHDCDTMPERWFRFTADIDPENIMIPVSSRPRELSKDGGDGQELGLGLYADEGDTILVYSAFLQYKRSGGDEPVLTAQGFLTFNNKTQTYTIMPQIDSSAKIIPPYEVVSFDRRSCTTAGSGKVNLVNGLGRMKMETFGAMKNTMVDGMTEAELVMTIDFPFDEVSMGLLTTAIEAETGTEGVNTSDDNFYNALKYQLGPEQADVMLSQLNLSGRVKELPDVLQHTFYLSQVKMKWNYSSRSFVSDGDIGIVSMGKTQMFKFVKGNMEIVRKRSGTIVTLYFEIGGDWYFFLYQTNRMQALSSNQAFVDAIKKAMGENKNIYEAKDKEPQYSFILSTNKRKSDFLKKIGAEQGGTDDE
jgi:hypothetical protein